MRKLKVCFVGIGSIAKRHIRNLISICKVRNIHLEIDALRRTDSRDINLNISFQKIFTDIRKLPCDYDVIFLTNPTEFHIDMLRKLHNHSKHFFIEKPITSYRKMNEIDSIKYRDESIYYVACPLRYTNVIQYIKNNIEQKDVISVRCISSSYLPDWRPNVDYRCSYSASKDLGGGVSIDLIHEWDYIKYLFGMPEQIFYTCGKKSSLELSCEDYAIYVAEYVDKILELHLDYFGRKAIREVMLITRNDTILADIVNSRISYLKSGRSIEFGEERDDYQKKELEHFLEIIEGHIKCDNGIDDAYQTLKLTQGKTG